jgi:hypothetical protein
LIITYLFLRCEACGKWAIKPGQARKVSGCRHGWLSRAARFESTDELHAWAYDKRWVWVGPEVGAWACPPCGRKVKRIQDELSDEADRRGSACCPGCGDPIDEGAHGVGACV